MFLLRENYQHPAFRQGVMDMAGAAPGIAAWGLMTGVAMVKSGMGTFEALLMAVTVFAGSSQLAAMPLMLGGAPMWVVLVTGFCVNLRFVVFSAHMRAHVMHLPRWQRLVVGYLTADLTYVLFVKRYSAPATEPAGRLEQMAYLAGNGCINWASWTFSSVAGVVLANFIPTHWGLGFAGILALVGLTCSLASTRLRWVSAGVAGAAAVVAFALPLKLNILVAIAIAVALCLWLENRISALQPPHPHR
ncbi:AzlC family ABC transporter permease [Rhodoferax sp.]|jgi:predicted branched-subunit amino acid permease|uniref:AzlC family ABC transporter permease n=1 Tax=Rhodoferax sp. TaxID=50421 RepID=UPI00378453B7